MPEINLTIKNKKNRGLVINSRELLALYFYGINIENQQGTDLSPMILDTYIRQAQDEIERYLTIRLNRQIVDEVSDYFRDEFLGTGFIKTKFLVNEAFELNGILGTVQQVSYPRPWLTNNTVDGIGNTRQIVIVPNSSTNSVSINSALFAGSVVPYIGLVNSRQISSYWNLKYCTGWGCEELPYDILDVIGKLASIRVFNILGDIVIGAGIASMSLSIDALSQSIATTSSAENASYSARIKQYLSEIKETLKRLTGTYKGVTLTSI